MKFLYLIITIFFIAQTTYAGLNLAQNTLLEAIKNNDSLQAQALIIAKKIYTTEIKNFDFFNKQKKTPLILAIENNNPEIVKALLNANANPNFNPNILPLSLALEYEYYEIANMLLNNKNFDISTKDYFGVSVFQYLTNTKKWLPLCHLYLCYFNENNKFYKACDSNIINTKIDSIYLDALKNNSKETKDIKAAWQAKIQALFFINKKNYKNSNNQFLNILYFIIKNDSVKMLKIYKKIFEEHFENIKINSLPLLHKATIYNKINIIKYILEDIKVLPDEERDRQGRTAFFRAVIEKKYQIAFLLFSHGASFKKKDKYGRDIKTASIVNYNSQQFIELLEQVSSFNGTDEEMNNIIMFLNNIPWSVDNDQTWMSLNLKNMFIKHLQKIKKKKDLLAFAQEQTKEEFLVKCLICEETCNVSYISGPALCQCFICPDCTIRFINSGLQNARTKDFICPNSQCNHKVKIDYLQKNGVSEEQLQQYALHMHLRLSQYTLPCPTPDCIGGVKESQSLTQNTKNYLGYDCKYCDFDGCIRCQNAHHAGQCEQIIDEDNTIFLNSLKKNGIRNCPGCNVAIQKNEGCSKMVCFKCQTSFSWYP